MTYATPDQLCELFQIKKGKLYKMTSKKLIPVIKIGNELRFNIEDVKKTFQVSTKIRRALL